MRERRKEKAEEDGRGTGAASVLTLGGCQHGRSQLALACFQVTEDEPAGEAVAHDGVQWAGVRFSGGKRCLQHRQPGGGRGGEASPW